jgi:hypothetical protein
MHHKNIVAKELQTILPRERAERVSGVAHIAGALSTL